MALANVLLFTDELLMHSLYSLSLVLKAESGVCSAFRYSHAGEDTGR